MQPFLTTSRMNREAAVWHLNAALFDEIDLQLQGAYF